MTLLLLAGCLSADSFSDRYVALACDRTEECSKASFEAQWDDQDECRDDLSDVYGEYFACLSDYCEFDRESAKRCLAWGRDASCDEFVNDPNDDCSEIFYDCDESEILGCALDQWL